MASPQKFFRLTSALAGLLTPRPFTQRRASTGVTSRLPLRKRYIPTRMAPLQMPIQIGRCTGHSDIKSPTPALVVAAALEPAVGQDPSVFLAPNRAGPPHLSLFFVPSCLCVHFSKSRFFSLKAAAV